MVQKMIKMNGSADMNEKQKLYRTYSSIYIKIFIQNLKVGDDGLTLSLGPNWVGILPGDGDRIQSQTLF
jgi:hypothetical protein